LAHFAAPLSLYEPAAIGTKEIMKITQEIGIPAVGIKWGAILKKEHTK
jgi:hypothetical protein